MLAHRRVDAQRRRVRALEHLAVDAFAHAVQALQLEARIGADAPGRTRHLQDRGDGAGVVGGELRVDLGGSQQALRAGQIAQVGVALVGPDRIARQAHFLRALDLAVPVGALDQAHHQPQAVAARDLDDRLDHFRRAGLVGLHRQAQAAPGGKALRHMRRGGVEHRQRQLQPLGLLGVDGEIQVGAGRGVHQREQARHHPALHGGELGRLIARVDRRELDRDAVAVLRPAGAAPRGDRADRVGIRPGVALRIGVGARAFAQHVEAVAQQAVLAVVGRGAVQRLADVLAEHELAAQQLDRAHRGRHHRLGAQALQQAGALAGGLVAGQHLLRQLDGLRRQVAHQRMVLAVVRVRCEVGAAELVGGQRQRGLGVGHAQQRLGQAHQRQTFGAGDRVFAQQRFHRPERRRVPAHRVHPRRAQRDDRRPVEPAVQLGQQPRDLLRLVAHRRRQAVGEGGGQRGRGGEVGQGVHGGGLGGVGKVSSVFATMSNNSPKSGTKTG